MRVIARLLGASAAALLFLALLVTTGPAGCATGDVPADPGVVDPGDAASGGEAGGGCTTDAQCPTGQRCVKGACALGCATDAQCPSGKVCNTAAHACVDCLADTSCSGATPRCDPATNKCVACLPSRDDCPPGLYCVGTSCVAGCRNDGDCSTGGAADGGADAASADAGGMPARCDVATHTCVACLDDSGCPLGFLCSNKACVPGCNAAHGCASGSGCCNAQCAPLNTTSNCSVCGAACDTTHSTGPSCNGATCSYASCAPGYDDCNKTAPDTDGCETALGTTPTSCGACGRACSNANVQALSCSGSLCTSTCQAGFGNCSKPAAPAADDGCESNLTTCVGSPCCGTLCTGLHQNGQGQTYADCVPFGVPGNAGTYSVNMANEAANAWPGGGSLLTGTCWAASDKCVAKQTGSQCVVWCYTGTTSGHVVLTSGTGGCGYACCCPATTDGTWN